MHIRKYMFFLFLSFGAFNTGYSIKKIVINNPAPFPVYVQIFNTSIEALNRRVRIPAESDMPLYENDEHVLIEKIWLCARGDHALVAKKDAEVEYTFSFADNNHEEMLIYLRARNTRKKINAGKNINNLKFNYIPLFFKRVRIFMSEQERMEDRIAKHFSNQLI